MPWWPSRMSLPRSDTPTEKGPRDTSLLSVLYREGVSNDRGGCLFKPREEESDASKPIAVNQECAACSWSSVQVYPGRWLCLNEHCERFFGRGPGMTGKLSITVLRRLSAAPVMFHTDPPVPLNPIARVSPSFLGLILAPPLPTAASYDTIRSLAGRDCWRGWVCSRCRMANERRSWLVAECEACHVRLSPPYLVRSTEATDESGYPLQALSR